MAKSKTLLKFKQMEALTAARALVSNAAGDVSPSSVTATELEYLDIVTLGTAAASKAVTVSAGNKITIGALEIEGSAFDINGGTINGVSQLACTDGVSIVDGGDGAMDGVIIGAATPAAITGTAGVLTSLSLSEGNLTNAGAISADVLQADLASEGLAIIFDGVTTKNRIELTNSLVDGLNIAQAGNSYLQFNTSANKIVLGQELDINAVSDFGSNAMTNVNIDSGTINGVSALACTDGVSIVDGGDGAMDGVIIGAATPAAGTFVALNGTVLRATISLQLATGATVTGILDEDNMATNSATQLATQQSIKAYVDNNSAGLDVKDSVKAASTGLIIMSSTASSSTLVLANSEGGYVATGGGSLTIDGVTMAQGDRVLIKDKVNSNGAGASKKWNGVYTVGAIGGATCTLTRATDFDVASEFVGAPFFFVDAGTVNGFHGFVSSLSTNPTIGTDDIKFFQFTAPSDDVAGNGIARAGNSLDLDVAGLSASLGVGGIHQTQDFLAVSDNGPSKKITFSDFEDSIFANMNAASSHVAIAAGGAITISAGQVANSMMAANSIDSDQYVDGSIDLIHMSANSVDSDQYVDGSIDTAHIANAQITVALMAVNSIDSDQYVDGSIDLIHMSANSIDSDQYVDGSIDSAHFSAGAVNAAAVAADAVVSSKIKRIHAIAKLNAGTTNMVHADIDTYIFGTSMAGSGLHSGTIDQTAANQLNAGCLEVWLNGQKMAVDPTAGAAFANLDGADLYDCKMTISSGAFQLTFNGALGESGDIVEIKCLAFS